MKNNKTLLLGLAAAAIGLAALAGFLLAQRQSGAVTAGSLSLPSFAADEDLYDKVELDGVTYRRRHDLTTVLFLGVDRSATVEAADVAGRQGRSDSIALFVLDRTAKTVQLLEISRDTIVNVDIYDGDGNVVTTAPLQLAMQYAFGTSAARACRLTQNKVSELLYGVPIDGTASLTMEGIPVLVDALGGVPITFAEGDSAIDPAWQPGSTAVLDGAAAERFVRYRDTAVTGSNDTRMGRQVRFFRALYGVLAGRGLADQLERLQKAAAPYLTSSIDAETMKALADYTLTDEALALPGQTVAGEAHDEFHTDDTALRALVVRLFYEPAG